MKASLHLLRASLQLCAKPRIILFYKLQHAKAAASSWPAFVCIQCQPVTMLQVEEEKASASSQANGVHPPPLADSSLLQNSLQDAEQACPQ